MFDKYLKQEEIALEVSVFRIEGAGEVTGTFDFSSLSQDNRNDIARRIRLEWTYPVW